MSKRGVPFILLRYITVEFAKTLALTLVVVTALWVFVTALHVLRHQYTGPREFLEILPLLALISMAYTLPMAVLFGASVSYGRMSFENEIRAMEWNGVHMGWVAAPAVVIAVITSAAAVHLTGNVVPHARVKFDRLVKRTLPESIGRQLQKAAQEGQSTGIGSLTVKLRSYEPETATLRDVTIVQTDGPTVRRRIDAPAARIVPGKLAGALVPPSSAKKPEGGRRYITFIFTGGRVTEFDKTLGSMVATGVAPPVAFDLSDDEDDMLNPDRLGFAGVLALAKTTTGRAERWHAWTDFYERIALGISPFFFALLAVPMALFARWKHTLTSFLPSLVVVMAVYYPLLMWAKVQGEAGRINPMYGMFMGDAAILVVSAALLIRLARR